MDSSVAEHLPYKSETTKVVFRFPALISSFYMTNTDPEIVIFGIHNVTIKCTVSNRPETNM